MILYNLLASLHSLWVCHGKHDWSPMSPFVSDPDGPETRTFAGMTWRGRTEHYNHCRQCGLRDDGKGYDP